MTDARKLREFGRRASHPCVFFGEHVAAAGATVQFLQHEFKTSRDMVVDYLAISEETWTQDLVAAGLGQTYLHYLDVRWTVSERAGWLPGESYGAIETFHAAGRDRSAAGIMDFANRFAAWGSLRWNHPVPWPYARHDVLSLEFSRPAVSGVLLLQPEPASFAMDAVGTRTGSGRSFAHLQPAINIFGQPAVALPPWTQAYVDNQNCANLGDEDFLVFGTAIVLGNRNDGAGAWNTDLRVLNHFRLRVIPAIGDSWSTAPVPLVFYGVDMGPVGRVAYHVPVRPLFLRAGESILLDVVNNGPQQTNVQAAVIGRTLPGVGGIDG